MLANGSLYRTMTSVSYNDAGNSNRDGRNKLCQAWRTRIDLIRFALDFPKVAA